MLSLLVDPVVHACIQQLQRQHAAVQDLVVKALPFHQSNQCDTDARNPGILERAYKREPRFDLKGLQHGYHFDKTGTMKSQDAIRALSALASEARLAVYRVLVKRGPEGYTPSELVKHLDVPAPTLSFHLKGLVQAGLIVSRRESRNLYYSPNFERMNALVGFLTENCCSLANEACAADCQPAAASSPRRKRA